MPDVPRDAFHPNDFDVDASDQNLYTLAALVDASDAAIIGKTLDNIILSWNRGAEKMYGYTAEEIVGRSIAVLLPPEREGELEGIIARVAQGERIEQYETVRMTRDGRRIDVSLIVSPTRDRSGKITQALTIARDISEHLQARQTLGQIQASAENRTVLLDAANRIALGILSNRSGIEALKHIAETARTLANARYAALGVARLDGKGLSEFITTGLTEEQERAIGPRPHGIGVLGLLLERTAPLRVGRIADHPDSSGFPPNHPPMTSFLGVPIRRGDTVLGSLYLTDKQGTDTFTEVDEAAVEALGAHAAIAINHIQMLDRQRALVRGLIAAQEEERRAVAYDLHDGLTQYVMASHAHLESFRNAHQAGKEVRAAHELEMGLRYLKEAVAESRRMVNGLRSLALDDLGVVGALDQLLAEEKARAGWEEANLTHNIAEQRFDWTLETAAYRVAQEALTNVRKHAGSPRVQVTLLLGNESINSEETPLLTLEVRDWGQGFVPQEKVDNHAHFGLQGMIERVRLMGGTLTIDSAPGTGTLVRALLPVPPTNHHEGGKGGETE